MDMGRASDKRGVVRTHNINLATGRSLVSTWNWTSSGGQQPEDLQWSLQVGHTGQLPLDVALNRWAAAEEWERQKKMLNRN